MRCRRLLVITASLAAAAAACGEGTPDRGTQPTPEVTTFEPGVFDDLPKPPRSEPFGARSEKDGAIARSYRATGITPIGVIDFYENALAERWTPAEPVFRADTNSRGDWINDDWRLEVSATRIEDRRNPSSAEAVVQFSLVLRPRGS